LQFSNRKVRRGSEDKKGLAHLVGAKEYAVALTLSSLCKSKIDMPRNWRNQGKSRLLFDFHGEQPQLRTSLVSSFILPDSSETMGLVT
jgi:hypothetical protein